MISNHSLNEEFRLNNKITKLQKQCYDLLITDLSQKDIQNIMGKKYAAFKKTVGLVYKHCNVPDRQALTHRHYKGLIELKSKHTILSGGLVT